jgi:hypothetical protein
MKYSNYVQVRKAVDARLCAYTALKEYMGLHASDYDLIDSDSIWLWGNGKKEVAPQTLATAVRVLMLDIGIDLIYGSATIRHAAITLWRDLGVSIDDVIDQTGHRSRSLVLKFYNKSTNKTDLLTNYIDDQFSDDEDKDIE